MNNLNSILLSAFFMTSCTISLHGEKNYTDFEKCNQTKNTLSKYCTENSVAIQACIEYLSILTLECRYIFQMQDPNFLDSQPEETPEVQQNSTTNQSKNNNKEFKI